MAAENRGPELAGVVILLLVFAILTVGLRCFTRKALLNVFFMEDWLAVVTLVSYDAPRLEVKYCELFTDHDACR